MQLSLESWYIQTVAEFERSSQSQDQPSIIPLFLCSCKLLLIQFCADAIACELNIAPLPTHTCTSWQPSGRTAQGHVSVCINKRKKKFPFHIPDQWLRRKRNPKWRKKRADRGGTGCEQQRRGERQRLNRCQCRHHPAQWRLSPCPCSERLGRGHWPSQMNRRGWPACRWETLWPV